VECVEIVVFVMVNFLQTSDLNPSLSSIKVMFIKLILLFISVSDVKFKKHRSSFLLNKQNLSFANRFIDSGNKFFERSNIWSLHSHKRQEIKHSKVIKIIDIIM